MKRRTARTLIALVSLLLLVAWFISHWVADRAFRSGSAAGAQARDRLQLVWPDVERMNVEDRRVLADLAMRCHLHEEPPMAENVVRCLQRAASGRESAKDSAVLKRLLPSRYTLSPEAR